MEEAIDEVIKLIYQGQYKRAADTLEAYEPRFTSQSGSLLHTKFLLNKGRLFVHQRRMTEADDVYEIVDDILEGHPEREDGWDWIEQKLCYERSRMEFLRGNIDLAKELQERTIEFDVDPGLNARAMLDLGNVLCERGDYSNGVEIYQKGIDIIKDSDDLYELARAYNNISDVFLKIRDYDQALKFADMCVELAKKLENLHIAGFGYMNGAEALVGLGEPQMAKGYHAKSKSLLSDMTHVYCRACLIYNSALVSRGLGKNDEAKRLFDDAIDILDTTDQYFLQARARFEYGLLLKQIGEDGNAEVVFKESIEILEKNKFEKELEWVKEHK